MTAATVKRLFALAFAGALLLGTPTSASAWNVGVHAWVARELHRKNPQVDAVELANRVYGATAFDLFTVRGSPMWRLAHDALHDPVDDAIFMPVWTEASTDVEVGFAFGFLSHNNAWGADHTAHIAGLTGGDGQGWIIAKAQQLVPAIEARLAPLGIKLPPPVTLLVGHILVEQAVDDLLVAEDPSIPDLLVQAAWTRDPADAELLARALAPGYAALLGDEAAAADFIKEAERLQRLTVIGYGWAMGQPNSRAIIASATFDQAKEFLGLPEALRPYLVPSIDALIGQAMVLCQDDYRDELMATKGWVNGQLASHGVAP
ncbi:MAG TPA: hypothetical protein VFP50_09160 [Anaeromyxobacteraceae bacterium]|nr:hypothetical protein [Anaeromyxobacteraceae bacterium]